jgi:hypothetical protein
LECNEAIVGWTRCPLLEFVHGQLGCRWMLELNVPLIGGSATILGLKSLESHLSVVLHRFKFECKAFIVLLELWFWIRAMPALSFPRLVYNSETMSDILVSDISDDDLRRSCDDTNLGNDKAGIARIQNQSSNNTMNALHSNLNRCNTTERCDSSDFNPRIVADPPISGTFSSSIQRQPSWPWTNSNNGHLVQPTMASLHSNVNTVFQ